MLPTELSKNTLEFPGIYRGTVIKNNDPQKAGRIKVRVIPMLYNIDDIDALPWAVPAFPLSCGAGVDSGSYCIPDIDSSVWVFFEAGDPHQPVYMNEATTGVHGQPLEFQTNYPNRRGFKTSSGVIFYVDDSQFDVVVHIRHPSGTGVDILHNGDLRVIAARNENKSVAGNQVITVQGNVALTAVGNVSIRGARVEIN